MSLAHRIARMPSTEPDHVDDEIRRLTAEVVKPSCLAATVRLSARAVITKVSTARRETGRLIGAVLASRRSVDGSASELSEREIAQGNVVFRNRPSRHPWLGISDFGRGQTEMPKSRELQ